MKAIIFLCSLLFALSAQSQRKIALIVAIGNYPDNSGWTKLSSLNDTKYIKQGLIKQGFKEDSISMLLDEQATKDGITNALSHLAETAKKDDIILFHFSGHGQQIYDDNKDEQDGYDEALIPFDAAARFDPVSYRGNYHLRDDEIGQRLMKIREKIGKNGSLVVLIDACHSATMHRGLDAFVARGTPVRFDIPGYVPVVSRTLDEEDFIGGIDKSNFVLISGSTPHQSNFETVDADGKRVGALSYAFARAVNDLTPGDSYDVLFRKIKTLIQLKTADQQPMIEGDKDLEVFGGKMMKSLDYIGIESWKDDYNIFFKAGVFNNVGKGAKFTVYAADDRSLNKILATGTVLQAGPFQSHGVLNEKISKEKEYQIKVDEIGFGDFEASIFISDDAKAPGLTKQIKEFIQPLGYLRTDGVPDYALQIKKDSVNGYNNILLLDKADSLRWKASLKSEDTLSTDDLKNMLSSIKKAMRVQYLRAMPDGGTFTGRIKVEINSISSLTSANELSMSEGDSFCIRIVNKNDFSVYFNLLNISPDNKTSVLIPHGPSAQDFVIHPGGTYAIPLLVVDPGTPLGTEFVKFIFTKSELDLRPVFDRTQTTGVLNRGIAAVVNEIFKDDDTSTAARNARIPQQIRLDEVGVISKSYTIKKKDTTN